jgi:hypothetical protein
LGEKLLYIKGEASGFLLPKSLHASGNFHFNSIQFHTIDVRNSLAREPFNLDELKTGFYHYSTSPTKDVRVFINETEFIQQTINDFLFTDIKTGKDILIEGISYTEYTATVYYILKKITVDSVRPKNTLTQNGTNLIDESQVNTINAQKTSIVGAINAPFKSGFLSILKYLLFAFLIFLFLKSLFGLSFITILFPILYFFHHLSRIIRAETAVGTSVLGTNSPIINFLGSIFTFFACYSIFKNSINFSNGILLLVGIGLLLYARTNNFLKWIGRILITLAMLYFTVKIYSFYKHHSSSKDDNTDIPYDDSDKWDYQPEESTDTVKTENQDTVVINYLNHNLFWKDNYRTAYQAKISVRKDKCNIARLQRDQLEINASDSRSYFGKVYANLINQNRDYLNSVVTEYAKIGKNKNLSIKQFADMVVTSVQNIPYCLVHELTHKEADKEGGYVREYHQGGGPCLDQTKFGLQAPVEFMGNFKGDCDTRSLFLYHILSKLGFKVVVLVSEEYGHSILGISGNYSGDYITYNGLKYYGWETTNTGFTPGNLNPEVGNMRYWEVALGNN